MEIAMPKNYSKNTKKLITESGISFAQAQQMKICDVSNEELNKIFGKRRFSEGVTAHEIPYFDLHGNPINFCRYRLFDADEFEPKYLQEAGKKSRFYFPPFVDWKKIAQDTSIPIYITEGERKSAKATLSGFPCIGLGGVWNWMRKASEDNPNSKSQPIKDFQLIDWKDREVYITFDSDIQFNPNIQEAARALRNVLVKYGADPYRKDLPHKSGRSKVGLDDFLTQSGGKKAYRSLPSTALLLNKTISGDDLMKLKFPDKRWLAKGFLPYGLTLIAGAPKTGKSWLVLECILALSAGRKVLSHYETEKIKCLYLALEDSESRLKSRIEILTAGGHVINNNSKFTCEWERVEDGGIQALERRLEADPSIKAIFIDTFAKMRRNPKARESLYHQDYDAVGVYKKMADRMGVSIILVHHTKKGVSDDFLESVSGSMGITGAADTVLVLKRTRNEDEATLNITGRDIGEQAIALKFENGLWTYKGQASEVFATETQQEVMEVMRAEGRPLRQRTLAELTGRKNGGFKKTLDRMVANGQITRDQKLFYHLVGTEENKPLKFEKKTEE
jgi:hypothetical protein